MTIIWILIVVSGCNGVSSFDRKATKIPRDETGYTIVSNEASVDENQMILHKDAIVKTLKNQGIQLGKYPYVSDAHLAHNLIHFIFSTDVRANDNQATHTYALGYLNVLTHEVHISSIINNIQYYRYERFITVGEDYALIKDYQGIRFVRTSDYEVIQAFDYPSQLMDHQKAQIVIFEENQIRRVHFSEDGQMNESPLDIPIHNYNILFDDILISDSDSVAYNIMNQTSMDYEISRTHFDNTNGFYTYNAYQQTITIDEQSMTVSAFFESSDTLTQFKGYLDECNQDFNTFYIIQSNDETYIIAYHDGGGLLFLTNYSYHYVFKVVEDSFIYIGYNPKGVIGIYKA